MSPLYEVVASTICGRDDPESFRSLVKGTPSLFSTDTDNVRWTTNAFLSNAVCILHYMCLVHLLGQNAHFPVVELRCDLGHDIHLPLMDVDVSKNQNPPYAICTLPLDKEIPPPFHTSGYGLRPHFPR